MQKKAFFIIKSSIKNRRLQPCTSTASGSTLSIHMYVQCTYIFISREKEVSELFISLEEFNRRFGPAQPSRQINQEYMISQLTRPADMRNQAEGVTEDVME